MAAADVDPPTVEDVSDEPEITEETPVPQTTADLPTPQPAAASSKLNRAEKKARKSLAKLNLQSFPGVTRVTIKKSKDILFVIKNPEVMKSPTGDTYVVFGECKVEDPSQQAAAQLANNLKAAQEKAKMEKESGDTEAVEEGEKEEGEKEGEVTADGEEKFSAKDIDLVMKQAEVSKPEAIEALEKAGGDIVNAIMELTE
eukprot:snap_masked-scaffold_21-processed-gene-2.5-mRNA-1 protein AED:0.09 eAED:0.11 QI:0/-1/0/1/-1/1/1/0/199